MSTTIDNPKEFMRGQARYRKMALIESVSNPIPDEISDGEELSRLFDRWNLVPYAGADRGTGHSTLSWFLMLAKLSPTHGAAVDKLAKYAFGSRAKFVWAEHPEYDIGEEREPMTQEQKFAYEAALLKHVVFDGGVRNFHYRLAHGLKTTGNAWVEMSVATVDGITVCHLRSLRQTDVIYVRTKPNEARVVALSPVWTDAYLRKHPPVLIPLYPNYTEIGGVRKTVFHLKSGDNNWYGRPDSHSAVMYMFREVQDAIYLTRHAANNFTGQIIIEIEDDGQSAGIDDASAVGAGFNSFAERLMYNFSNQSESPLSVLVASRPFGAKPMFVFQVKPNTSESWYKVTGEMAKGYILSAHGLTLRFMGEDVSNGFSKEAFIADYIMNVEPVIMALRRSVLNFTNSILSAVWREVGLEEMDFYSLDFTSPIQSQVYMYTEKIQS